MGADEKRIRPITFLCAAPPPRGSAACRIYRLWLEFGEKKKKKKKKKETTPLHLLVTDWPSKAPVAQYRDIRPAGLALLHKAIILVWKPPESSQAKPGLDIAYFISRI